MVAGVRGELATWHRHIGAAEVLRDAVALCSALLERAEARELPDPEGAAKVEPPHVKALARDADRQAMVRDGYVEIVGRLDALIVSVVRLRELVAPRLKRRTILIRPRNENHDERLPHYRRNGVDDTEPPDKELVRDAVPEIGEELYDAAALLNHLSPRDG